MFSRSSEIVVLLVPREGVRIPKLAKDFSMILRLSAEGYALLSVPVELFYGGVSDSCAAVTYVRRL
jgi:hypothetical protein